MTHTDVTHDPQRVLADLRAALEECKCERDEARAALNALVIVEPSGIYIRSVGNIPMPLSRQQVQLIRAALQPERQP